VAGVVGEGEGRGDGEGIMVGRGGVAVERGGGTEGDPPWGNLATVQRHPPRASATTMGSSALSHALLRDPSPTIAHSPPPSNRRAARIIQASHSLVKRWGKARTPQSLYRL